MAAKSLNELQQRAALTFLNHPDAKSLLVTEDGNCFLESADNAAKSHAKSVGLKIITIQRSEVSARIQAIEEERIAAAKRHHERIMKEQQEAKALADQAAKQKEAEEEARKKAEAEIAAKAKEAEEKAQAEAEAAAKAAEEQAKAKAEGEARDAQEKADESASANAMADNDDWTEKTIADIRKVIDTITSVEVLQRKLEQCQTKGGDKLIQKRINELQS